MIQGISRKSTGIDYKLIIAVLVVWRGLLYVFQFLAFKNLPLRESFLGGSLENYYQSPFLWSWINFDGEHYLSIALKGYQPLTYFYFPMYPLMVRLMANVLGGGFIKLVMTGLFISHVSLLLGLWGLYKLILLDYKKNVADLTLILLLVFPTSYYFVSFYTESLFLALSVWSFYLARRKWWIYSGILGFFLTATRVVGLALLPALLTEVWLQKDSKKVKVKKILAVLLIPLGLVVYMVYLNKTVGDPLGFFHSVEIFGQQRVAGFVLLPQVFYRYIIKILPVINYSYFPVVFTSWLEFICAFVFGVIILTGIVSVIKKIKERIRLSYLIYLVFGYLIPTFAGSFSSMPRYVLVLFPAFLLLSLSIQKLPKVLQAALFVVALISLGVATSLFVCGYWVS